MIPATIPDAVRLAARRWPDREAVVDGDVRLSWSELADRMALVAGYLAGRGIRPGDTVAIWAPNSAQWLVASLGVYAAGGVLVPVNTRFKLAEATYVLRAAKVRLVFTADEFLGREYGQELAGLAGELDVVSLSGDFSGDGRTLPYDVRPDDLSDIIFTSGTTGVPKGAMLTHGASTRTYAAWSETVGLRRDDRYLVVYPFFHCAGLKSGVLAGILTGATILPCAVFDVPAVLDLVARERISMLPGPPTLYQSLLASDLSNADLRSLRLAVTGAAVVPVELVGRMRDTLGFSSVVTGYGLTETTGTATMCRHDDPLEVIATTSGRPIPGMSVCVVDKLGGQVPTGTPGEVLVRGFGVMKGYFGDPAATAAAMTDDGWLRTGDVGVLDAGGNLRITDRIKDMFVVGGFNAYPAEIEGGMLRHPAIAQVSVIGVPDERLGEAGCAFVVVRAEAKVEADELIAWCREEMANFKVPRHIRFVAALPLNASGKVSKVELRRLFSEGA